MQFESVAGQIWWFPHEFATVVCKRVHDAENDIFIRSLSENCRRHVSLDG